MNTCLFYVMQRSRSGDDFLRIENGVFINMRIIFISVLSFSYSYVVICICVQL